jgi:predicted nuclease of predicted toxin-antitoxin system
MLRFLTDEDFDGRLTSGLLARLPGLDLLRVQDVGLMHTPDPDILAWAAATGRIVLTHDCNRDAGPFRVVLQHRERPQFHRGVASLRDDANKV